MYGFFYLDTGSHYIGFVFHREIVELNKTLVYLSEKAKDGTEQSGVVYLSRLPWGFEEDPMRKYFKQFGGIKRMRVSRSKKTGNSRGYAYIQFHHDEVAKIVADTMNNYLMFGKLIKCRYLPTPHSNTFKNANKKFFQPGLDRRKSIAKHNSTKSEASLDKSKKKMLAKYTKLQAKLAAGGINYKLEDAMLEKCRDELKEKAAKRLQELKKNKPEDDDDKDEDDSDDDDSEDSDDESDSNDENEEIPEFSLMGSKVDKTKTTPAKVSKSVPTTPKSAQIQKKTSQSTGKPKGRHSLIPTQVDTPKGKRNVLIEDSSEDEIEFKTPPLSIKSSKLNQTLEAMKQSPAPEKTSPKRKNGGSTPKLSAKKMKVSSDTPVNAVKSTPKTPKLAGDVTVGKNDKKGLVTPKSAGKNVKTPKSDKKTQSAKKHRTPKS